MYSIAIPRSDLTTAEVVTIFRQGLGTRYHVLAGIGINGHSVADRVLSQPDSIVVGTGSNRVFRTEVLVSWHSGHTVIDVHPGGRPGTFSGGLKLINRLWIARKTHHVLEAALELR